MKAMSVQERFSANLLRYRKRADISQEELGFRASLHRTEIGKLERGEHLPRLDTVVKLAGALRIDSRDLLDGMSWEPGWTCPRRFQLPVRWALLSDHA
jgi:transcriptional regulator with XRE-family HTH domain